MTSSHIAPTPHNPHPICEQKPRGTRRIGNLAQRAHQYEPWLATRNMKWNHDTPAGTSAAPMR
eukprot:10665854-Lingulodinium_polyedra.AAC.1